MNFFSTLKLRWFVARKSVGFSYDYLQSIYKIYLNHTKIIHWRDGYPVYSMATPAVYTKPMANFMARQFYRSVHNKNIPNLLSFAINDDCNAACKHCSFYGGVDDKTRATMTTEQAKKVIRDAQELGTSVINIVGGEPTLHQDLAEIIKSVNKDLSTVIMFTNGSILAEQASSLRDAGLDGVYVSIDAPDPAIHDAFRNHDGLFGKALKGIQVARRSGMTVGISVTVSPETFKNGDLDKLIELAKEQGVHEVIVFDAMPTGRFQKRDDLIDNFDWIEKMIASVEHYNTDPTYPGILVYAYATSHRSVGCVCGTSYCYVSPYGDMMSCDFNHTKFGNVLEQPFYKVWESLTSSPGYGCAKWGGCKVKDSEFRKNGSVCTGKGCGGTQ